MARPRKEKNPYKLIGKQEAIKIQMELKREKLQRMKMIQWRLNPLLWLKERFDEDPANFKWSMLPEYKDHRWDGTKDPLLTAWNALASGKWVAVESATGVSKTYWAARVVFWFLDVYRDSLVVTTAPKQDQLKLHIWSEMSKIFHKFKKIHPKAEMLTLGLRVDNDDKLSDEESLKHSWQAVGFVAGSGADEQSATSAQGFHRKDMLFIIEETPGVNPALMTAFEQTSVGDNNLILALGNPDNENDTLHRFSKLSYVKPIRVSAYDYPNIVCGKTVFPGAVTPGSIQKRIEKYGKGSPMFDSRVRGVSPKQGVDSLIKLDWIEKCIVVHGEETPKKKKQMETSYNACGIDVAKSDQGDTAGIAWGVANTLVHLEEFQCPNASHLAYNVLYDDMILRANGYEVYGTHKLAMYGIDPTMVGVDVVGVGASTIETFANEGLQVTGLQGGQWVEAIPLDSEGKPLFNFISLRAQMWWEAREDLRQGKVALDISDKMILDKLTNELTVPKWDNKGNTIAVERKDSIRKRLGYSPTFGDCFVYWNWTRKGYRASSIYIPFRAA